MSLRIICWWYLLREDYCMLWYDYLVLLIIFVSFSMGFYRGLFKSLIRFSHYLVAPLFICKASSFLAQSIINKASLAQFIYLRFRGAFCISGLQLSYLPAGFSIIENWNLIEYETRQFINGSEFPLLSKETLLHLLTPQNVSVVFQRYSNQLKSLEDIILFYISDIFTSALALCISVFIIFIVIFVFSKIIMLLVALPRQKEDNLILSSRFAGGLWACMLRLAYISFMIIILQPIFLMLAISIPPNSTLCILGQLANNSWPWLVDTILKIFLGIGSW